MTVTTPGIAGCSITPIEQADCGQAVAWLVGDGAAPDVLGTGFTLALAHSDDGVTWGRLDETAGRWRLGYEAVPDVSPPIRIEALQELRIFGERGELLIWRSDEGLRGRLLQDSEDGRDDTDPLRPSDECRIVRGDRVVDGAGAGFTRVTDAAGAEQVLPAVLDDGQLGRHEVRLRVRHYWAQDGDVGTVRIAATRLVQLTTGERNAG